MVEAYCTGCKKKVEMKDIVIGKTKKGTEMRKGVCSICGRNVCRLGKLKE